MQEYYLNYHLLSRHSHFSLFFSILTESIQCYVFVKCAEQCLIPTGKKIIIF